LRAPSRSESQPEKTLSRLAVASAMPSIRPMMPLPTPSTLLRKRGRRLITISLEMSIKKLVRLTAQTLRGSERQPVPGVEADVVLLNRAALELAYAMIAQGKVLYERDLATRVEYEATILSRYGDMLPVLRAQREDILRGDDHEDRVRRYRAALGQRRWEA
jgi:hypothetical protein